MLILSGENQSVWKVCVLHFLVKAYNMLANRSRKCKIDRCINSQRARRAETSQNQSSARPTGFHLEELIFGDWELSLFMTHCWLSPHLWKSCSKFSLWPPSTITIWSWKGPSSCSLQQPITSFSGWCHANYHQSKCLSSEAILDPVLVMSHWPRGWHLRLDNLHEDTSRVWL